MKNNRVVLPLIIILLLCFLPLSAYGIYNRIVFSKEGGNPEHLHKVGDTLYFYDSANNLVGTYKCINAICDNALGSIDDEYLNYYEGSGNNIGLIGDNYIIVQDGANLWLHSLTKGQYKGTKLIDLSLIKNYGTIIEGNHLIVKDEMGKYGLINLDTMSFAVERNYMFMGLAKNFNEAGELSIERIAVLEDTTWYIIDSTEKKLSQGSIYPIYDYDEMYIYYVDDKVYYIHKYDGTRVLSEQEITKINTIEDKHVVQTSDGKVIIYDYMYQNITKSYEDFDKTYTFNYEEDSINIYEDNKVIDKIEGRE